MEYHQSITGLPFLEAIFLDLPTLLDFLKVEDDKKFEYQKWKPGQPYEMIWYFISLYNILTIKHRMLMIHSDRRHINKMQFKIKARSSVLQLLGC